MKTYFGIYFLATILGLLLTPLAIRVGRVLKIMDLPGLRKVHHTPVPRLGGVVIAVAMMTAILCVLTLDNNIGLAFRQRQSQVLALLAAAVFMLTVGLIDDIRGLPAKVKFAAEVIAATGVCFAGIRITSFSLAGWLVLDLGWLSWPITVLWIVAITNAVNLIDGLDGLAGGVCVVVSAVIFAFAIYSGQLLMAATTLALMGGLTGFLFFNFNPAKIFMGDCGAYFLGFVLASTSVMCTTKAGTIVGLALPALALGVPIFDTLLSILRRALERHSLFSADREHIHHKLLNRGLRHRHVVGIMYAVTLLSAGLGMFMMATRDAGTLMVFGCVLLLLLLVFRTIGVVRLRKTLTALQQNIVMSRQSKSEQLAFEQGRLKLRQADSFKGWWSALCAAAQDIGFAGLAITECSPDGSKRMLLSQNNGNPCRTNRAVQVAIEFGNLPSGTSLQLQADLDLDGSLEVAGRRLALLGRMFDEDSFAKPQAGFHCMTNTNDEQIEKSNEHVELEPHQISQPHEPANPELQITVS